MAFKIGTDEAGYGPNLGPLVVTGTLWKADSVTDDLYPLLAPLVTASPLRRTKQKQESILIADSKLVYRGKSIEALERAVLAVVSLIAGRVPNSMRELTKLLTTDLTDNFFKPVFWLAQQEVTLPLVASVDQITETASQLASKCDESGVNLLAIQSQIVLPEEFNESVIALGNKANVLSGRTMAVVARLLNQCDAPTMIDCDKHGGRSSYSDMIQHYLTDTPVTIVKQSAQQSDYCWEDSTTGKSRAVTARFTAKGEGQLSVALASMISKYVREVYMKAWNDYWHHHQTDLKPTKGYPVDAKRFRNDIAETQKKLGITHQQFWRSR